MRRLLVLSALLSLSLGFPYASRQRKQTNYLSKYVSSTLPKISRTIFVDTSIGMYPQELTASSSDISIANVPSGFRKRLTNNAGTDSQPSRRSPDLSSYYRPEPVSVISNSKRICSDLEILDPLGNCVEPQVIRDLFVFREPPKPKPQRNPYDQIPKPKVKVNVVVIRIEDEEDDEEPIVIPPPEEKTIVLVLSKKEDDSPRKIIEVPAPVGQKPEVFFIDYNEGDNTLLPGDIYLQDALKYAEGENEEVLYVSNGGNQGGPSDSQILLSGNQGGVGGNPGGLNNFLGGVGGGGQGSLSRGQVGYRGNLGGQGQELFVIPRGQGEIQRGVNVNQGPRPNQVSYQRGSKSAFVKF